MAATSISSVERRIGVVDHHGRFVWYELMTTDMAAAKAFYAKSSAGARRTHRRPIWPTPCSPPERLRSAGSWNCRRTREAGARRRGGWDMSASTTWTRLPSGSSVLAERVYVPPTDSNIGRIAVVADPQTATLALVEGLRAGQTEAGRAGRAGTRRLARVARRRPEQGVCLLRRAFRLAEGGRRDRPVAVLSAVSRPAGRRSAACSTKRASEPVPFWLYYFNVDDIDVALRRREDGGGRVFEGPLELPGGSWIARCIDPQGAAFALQGKRSQDAHRRRLTPTVGWSTEWGGYFIAEADWWHQAPRA